MAELLQRLTPTTWVTWAIVAVLIVSFLACVAAGMSPISPTTKDLLRLGGSYGPFIAEGEGWRLFTATLLHAGVIHLGFNVYVFYSGGLFAERLFGNVGLLVIYLYSGLGASLLSVVIHPQVVSVGASGAVFGVYGALLAFMLLHRGVLPKELIARQRNSLLGFIVLNVVIGLGIPNIDLSGHAGGLFTGLIVGAAMTRDLVHPEKSRHRRIIAAAGLAVLLAAITVVVLKNLSPVRD